MAKAVKAFRFSKNMEQSLEHIQQTENIKSATATIEFLIQFWHQKHTAEAAHVQLQQQHKTLTLHTKYLNQLRRENYILLDLLNAICLEQSITACPPHHEHVWRSHAMSQARENLSKFLKQVFVKNAWNEKGGNSHAH